MPRECSGQLRPVPTLITDRNELLTSQWEEQLAYGLQIGYNMKVIHLGNLTNVMPCPPTTPSYMGGAKMMTISKD